MILRAKKAGNFTTVYNEFIYDKRLSARAKGLLLWIMSKPDNWVTYKKNIANDFKEGTAAMWNAMKELIDFGYVIEVDEIGRSDSGQFSGNKKTQIVYEVSIYSDNFESVYGRTEKPKVQELHSRLLINTKEEQILNNNLLNTKKEINTKKDTDRFFSFLSNVGLKVATQKTLEGMKSGNSISVSILPQELLVALIGEGCTVTKYGKLIYCNSKHKTT